MAHLTKSLALTALALMGSASRGEGGPSKEELEAMLTGFISKQGGDASRAAAVLYDDNYKLREQKRTLESEIAELKRNAPGTDAVVLKGDALKEYNSLKELGTVKEITTKIKSAETLQSELSGVRKNETLTKAAQAHGFNPEVLKQLAKDADIEIKEVDSVKDGQNVKISKAYIKDGDKVVGLDEYAKTTWSVFLPSLSAGGDTSQQRRQEDTGFVPFVPQGQGGTGDTNLDPVAKFRQEQDKARQSSGNLLTANMPSTARS